jgi:hypothetical protein
VTDYNFELGMQRLTKVYGLQAYPAERKMMILKAVKDLSDEAWVEVVSEIIGSHRYAPMADKIAEIARPWVDRLNASRAASHAAALSERRASGLTCRYCDDSGLITAFKKESGCEVSFRCPDADCQGAKVNCNRFDVPWSARFENDYVPVFTLTNHFKAFEQANQEWIKARDERLSPKKCGEDFEKVVDAIIFGSVEPELSEEEGKL